MPVSVIVAIGGDGCGREVWRINWVSLQRGFKIEEFFMKFLECDGGISCLDSTNQFYVVISKSI